MKELLIIQNALRIEKKRKSEIGGKEFKFWHYEDILRDSRKILQQNKCIISFSEEILAIGNKSYISSTAWLTNSNGESYSATGISRESFNSNMEIGQMTETATSYARKSALTGLLGLYPANEPDYDKEVDTRPLMTMIDKLTLIKEQAQQNNHIDKAAKILNVISRNDPDEMQKTLNDYADYIAQNPIELKV